MTMTTPTTPIASLVWITPDAEKHMTYCARVSSPVNQETNANPERLISYLVKHNHWSPFEMASACFEVNTTRDISAQILRHRSFSFQEFSQRYADVNALGRPEIPAFRRQDLKNRQASHDDLDADTLREATAIASSVIVQTQQAYQQLLDLGIAKECARKVLPMNSPTRLYMSGTIRSWIHYLGVRTGPETQLEHRQIAQAIAKVLSEQLPSLGHLFHCGGSL